MRFGLRLATVAILVVAPLHSLAGRTAAASEGASVRIPGASVSAVVADVDADGEREVVRLVDEAGPGFTIEAWRITPDGWEAIGTTALDAPTAGLDDGETEAVIGGEIAALVTWTVGGRPRALALAAPRSEAPFAAGCCLAIHEVVATADGLQAVPMGLPEVTAHEARTLDLDGDGTDELVLFESAPLEDGEGGLTRLAILRWDGDAWDAIHRQEVGFEFSTLHTGAAAGGGLADVLIGGPTPTGELFRIGAGPGGVEIETGHVDIGPGFDGWATAAAGEHVVLTSSSGVHVVDWPREGTPSIASTPDVPAFAAAFLFESDDDAFVVTLDGGFGARTPEGRTFGVFDLDLQPVAEIEMPPITRAVWEILFSDRAFTSLAHDVYPYIGPLPGAIDGRAGMAVAGVLLQSDGRGGVASSAIAPTLGRVPIGRIGSDDAWVALGSPAFGVSSTAYLFPHGTNPPGSGGVVATPADRLLDPSVDPPAISIRGAVETGRSDGEIEVAATEEPFTIEVRAEPGSVVITADQNFIETAEVDGDAEEIEVRTRRPGSDGIVEHWIGVIEPDGRGSVVRVVATVLTEPPTVSASASVEPLSFRATIVGSVSEPATVTVNGARPFMLGSRRYTATVDAPIWPTDVVIVARDPFGRESITRVQVVGFLDYRGLPWAAIVGAGILAAGTFLFLRTPTRREPMLVASGDGTFEEFDGD